MSHKRKAEEQITKENEGPGTRGEEGENSENLIYEDDFEDDYESESIEEDAMDVEENDKIEDNDKMDKEDDKEDNEDEGKKLWHPSVNPLGPGEQLEYDNSAYDMIHFVTVEWPCLSFDILTDHLGTQRSKFPHTIYIAAGTQAERQSDNRLLLLKLSDLHKTKNDDDEDEGIDLDEASDLDDDPILEYKSIPASHGSFNRVRAMPQQPHIIAANSSEGPIDIFDAKQYISALDKPPRSALQEVVPKMTFEGHPVEGWALDWSPKAPGRLLSGDCSSNIYQWEPLEAGSWNVDKFPFSGHKDSVEDLQWSPSEPDVFASCSVDRTIKLWDGRKGKTSVASIDAHSSDVNVISWNHKRAFLIVSGSDDGNFKVWDLRKLGADTKHQFSFSWHNGAISSIEWNPNDDSGIAVASEDNSVSIWDLSLSAERSKVDGIEIPSQLLFVHQGQQHIKEVHWHNQIPGVLVTTALDGFNVFKPSNV